MSPKAVIIASGGIDSSTLLYKMVNEGFEVYALTFIYGQRHLKEINSANRISESLNIAHKVVNISAMKELLLGSALTDSNVEVPEVPETAEHFETLKVTIVPNRNAIFLSIAIGYAVSIGANHVFFGAHFSDRGVYPDCRKEFVEAFQNSERLATDNDKLVIDAPFVDIEKSEIIKLGVELGVPFKHTWTCYKGGERHCGVCSSCRERKRAFVESGVQDPTEYEQ
ncbi:MAG: 7-cyano-7-deazaguanine synthase QueC [Candidatus Dadabacteria bacterium]|jgi:7-cyano-7-deazaguanine synthase|nr:7-cyano-7-deazaguanine synthase QueC [Candidatus Dadabacteria bacterium]MCZ6556120.1 7-cyano-7-deazaguanine synthase QueC [Candidatus Dadabacteria bacterium]MCZ6864357.1 7-cyano-7-deazaguanine synthase QueC [Candidatus Dadabacteria bacterium]